MEAKEFDSHGLADRRAEKIREETGDHVHAAICEKPMPPRVVPDPSPRVIKTEPAHLKVDRFREAQCRRDPVEAAS